MAPAYLVCVALLGEFSKVPVKGCASHSGFPHKLADSHPSSGAVQSASHSVPFGCLGNLGDFLMVSAG